MGKRLMKTLKQYATLGVVLFAFVGMLLIPQPAHAQVQVIGDIQRTVQGSTGVLDAVLKVLNTIGQFSVKNGLSVFLDRIAYDTAVWLASGDENQKPLLYTKDAGTYLQEVGDAAAGEILNDLGRSIGFDLCNIGANQSLQLQGFLPSLLSTSGIISSIDPRFGQVSSPTSNCTLSSAQDNMDAFLQSMGENFSADKLLLSSSPDAINIYLRSQQTRANSLMAAVAAMNVAADEAEKAEQKATIERLKSDFRDQTAKISGYIETPASIIQDQQENSSEQATALQTTLTGNPVVDALGTFANTLINRLLEKAQSGLLSFYNEIDINESLSGASSTARGGGVREARLQFASYKTPPITSGGTVSILTQFAACPTEGADVINCVINEEFRLAIDEKKTVRQLVDETSLGDKPFGVGDQGTDIENPEEGISLRSVRVLKEYSVVPVGWEAAAEYHRDFEPLTRVTLRDVVEAYDNCGEENYSPYCGLVDPDWVLKAPEVYCKVQGFGENIGASVFVDMDGPDATGVPQQLQVNRLKSCLDPQTCLSEDDNGACEAYGYCVKQEDIYRFQGDSCPVEQVSCEVFNASNGTQVAYLENTLNYNDCNADNDGCAWRCTQWNDIDKQFQCKTQNTLYPTCTDPNGCSTGLVTANGDACPAASCTIQNGGFTCSAENTTCYLPGGEVKERIAITFDNDVQTCSERDANCMSFAPVLNGNILFNSSFEYFENNGNEVGPAANNTLPFTTAFAAYRDLEYSDPSLEAGDPCYGNGNGFTTECTGWTGTGARVVSVAHSGDVAAQLQNGSGRLFSQSDTGHALANRTFVLRYQYLNTSDAVCTGSYRIRSVDDSSAGTAAVSVSYNPSNTDGFQEVVSQPFTFGASVADTAVGVELGAAQGCDIVIDSVQLQETTGRTDLGTNYADYGANQISLKTDVAQQCSPDDVGCLMYTPLTGESRLPVPGKITNPLSDACGNGNDFGNPECSQCLAEFVGCEAFIEKPTPFRAPLKTAEDVAGLDAENPEQKKILDAVADRSGYYCENTNISCIPGREAVHCGTGVACVPSVSIVPSTGQTCSAQEVGCEEYVNIDQENQGGESLQYFSYIRQCVKPTALQREQGTIDTYFTFEGSDQTGYQLRSWELKKSNIDADGDGYAAPCTNLDLTGSTGESAEADCVDTEETQATCTAADIHTNPDCVEYTDRAGNTYYRLKSATITVSESCTALRNSLDGRVYHSIPSESVSCSASAAYCREFQGAAGNNSRLLIEENFNQSVWDGGFSSGAVVTANTGQSMQIGDAVNSSTALKTLPIRLSKQKTYVASFWAKGDQGEELEVFIQKENRTVEKVVLTGEWQKYDVGPFTITDEVLGNGNGNESFGFLYDGEAVYIDNVTVRENNSFYIIHDSARLCSGFEGCEQYQDNNGVRHFLKSFIKLCQENVVGCQALFNTHASTSPNAQTFNGGGDPLDDIIVPEDTIETRVVTEAAKCNPAAASCQAMGLPTLNAAGEAKGYTTQYLLNDPDQYGTTLCQQHQMSCEAYTASDGTQQYFKNPGEKTCEYDSALGEWRTKDGQACPLQNPNDAPSQPKGSICAGGPRDGFSCNADTDCHTVDNTEGICTSTANMDSGWVGMCSPVYAGCTMYQDPNTESVLRNGSFEVDITDVAGTATSGDGQPDDWDIRRGLHSEEQKIFPGGPDCQVVERTQERVVDGRYALKLKAFPVNQGKLCQVTSFEPENRLSADISVDPNKTYALRAHVWAEGGALFSVGLTYWKTGVGLNGQPVKKAVLTEEFERYIANPTPEANFASTKSYAVAAIGGPFDRYNIDTPDYYKNTPEGEWIRFQGLIGATAPQQFPEGTEFVRVAIEVKGDGHIYVDNVQFSEVGEYSYINSSIDGAPESDVNNCNGVVDPANGCVAFREVGDSNNTTISTAEKEQQLAASNGGDLFTPANCVSDGTISEAGQVECNRTPNAADTNRVLQVERDRQCAEWLSCTTYTTIEVNGKKVNSCTDFGICNKRNPETGVCEGWAKGASSIAPVQQGDILHFESQPGDSISPYEVRMYSGLARVGVKWVDSGNQSYGYYPVNWMPQRGVNYVSAGDDDIIEGGDFEAVYCNGSSELGTAYGDLKTIVDAERDNLQRCTLDVHCRTASLDAAVKSSARASNSSISVPRPTQQGEFGIDYSVGMCGTVKNHEWNNWRTVGGANMAIIDYDDSYNYTFTKPDKDSNITDHDVASASLDLNNVLYVVPRGVNSGIEYASIPLNGLTRESEFVVSFDAKYAGNVSANSAITVFLQYSTPDGVHLEPEYFTEAPSSNTRLKFATQWHRYVLGPVRLEHMPSNATSATLVIGQASSGVANPFYIDNISMRPALELGAAGRVQGDTSGDISKMFMITESPLLSARSCRAYPEADSLQCNYREKSGVIYEGWKGYCLAREGVGQDRCISWWPVGSMAGEKGIEKSAIQLRYTDQTPAYHCLVAKGNEDLGACSDTGEMCSSAADCRSGATCIGNMPESSCYYNRAGFSGRVEEELLINGTPQYCSTDNDCARFNGSLPSNAISGTTAFCKIGSHEDANTIVQNNEVRDTNYDFYPVKHDIETRDYSIIHRINHLWLDNPKGPQGKILTGLLDGAHTKSAEGNKEQAAFVKMTEDQLSVERLVHISEISNITFNFGKPTIVNESDSNNRGHDQTWEVGTRRTVTNAGNSVTYDVNLTRDVEPGKLMAGTAKGQGFTGGKLWSVHRRGEGGDEGAYNNAWVFNTSDAENDATVAIQSGFWCGARPCNSIPDDGNVDFVYVKGVSNAEETPDADRSNLLTAGRVGHAGEPLNPFHTFQAHLRPNNPLWNTVRQIGGKDGKSNYLGGVYGQPEYRFIDNDEAKRWYTYFAARNAEFLDIDESPEGSCYTAGRRSCGANIVALRMRFEAGYLKEVYLIYWNGFQRVDPQSFKDIEWRFELREPCLLAVPSAELSANGDVRVTPWRQRISQASDYRVPGLFYKYQLMAGQTPYSWQLFGMIGPAANGANPTENAGDASDVSNASSGGVNATSNVLASAGSLPMIYVSGSEDRAGAALPFACVGKCTNTICQVDFPYTPNQFNPAQPSMCGSDDTGKYISLEGICVYNGPGEEPESEKGKAVPCDPHTANICGQNYTCVDLSSALDDKGVSEQKYVQKLTRAAEEAWSRYRTIFADIAKEEVYIALPSRYSKSNQGGLTKLSLSGAAFSQQIDPYEKPAGNPNNLSLVGNRFNERIVARGTTRTAEETLKAFFADFKNNLPECSSSSNRDAGDYCAIRPRVENMTIARSGSGQGPIRLKSGESLTLMFRPFVDPEQYPLETIFVDWYGIEGQGFQQSRVKPFAWGGVPMDVYPTSNTYTCVRGQAGWQDTDGDGQSDACVYRIRVQIQDAWLFCSGANGSARRGNCSSYDEYPRQIIVSPAR